MSHVLALFYVPTLWHPLSGMGYQFWSGIAGATAAITGPFVTGVAVWRVYRRRTECHVEGCSKHGEPVHGTGYRACHKHHPGVAHGEGEVITAEHIATAHRRLHGA